MKTLILAIFMAISALLSYSQNVEIETKSSTFKTEQEAIGKATATTKTAIVGNKTVKLYQGSRGGYFYITTTSKGEYRKVYVNIKSTNPKTNKDEPSI